jgi:hypothetical protein
MDMRGTRITMVVVPLLMGYSSLATEVAEETTPSVVTPDWNVHRPNRTEPRSERCSMKPP